MLTYLSLYNIYVLKLRNIDVLKLRNIDLFKLRNVGVFKIAYFNSISLHTTDAYNIYVLQKALICNMRLLRIKVCVRPLRFQSLAGDEYPYKLCYNLFTLL